MLYTLFFRRWAGVLTILLFGLLPNALAQDEYSYNAIDPLDQIHLVINIPSRTLALYEDTELVKSYPVGLGRLGLATPVGQYAVLRKVYEPGWENPYLPQGKMKIKPATADNPLGTRWIGFKRDQHGEYGIHGTNEPDSVGKFVSHGCVRMRNSDVEALFDKVSIGTPVKVTYSLVAFNERNNAIYLTVYRDIFKRGLPSVKTIHERIDMQYPEATQINDKAIQLALQKQQSKAVPVASALY